MTATPGPGPPQRTIHTALAVAGRAPSVHNTQPWRWAIDGPRVHLLADPARRLRVADPQGRELTISCGAVLHHARIAFRALGWWPTVHRPRRPTVPNHLATIELTPMDRPDPPALVLLAAAGIRRTDRRAFPAEPVPDLVLHRVGLAGRAEGVRVGMVRRPATRRDVVVALGHADARLRADPHYRRDIRRGAPTSAVPAPRAGASDGPVAGRGEPELLPALNDGALLCVLSTDLDDRLEWLRTGEALSAILLAATGSGLATCTLGQVAEVRTARDLVRATALAGLGEPQLVLRIGWPPTTLFPTPPSPRLALSEVLTRWRG